jgi:hypothetical protein
LIEKPAPPFRGPGGKFHVLMAEDDTGGGPYKFLAVFDPFSVQGDDLFTVFKHHRQSAGKGTFQDRRDRTISFSGTEEFTVFYTPEGGGIRAEIKGLKEISFSLAVFSYEKYILSLGIYFNVLQIAEGGSPQKSKTHNPKTL